ncbi:hypothetical protein N8904_00275 [Flavobacteriales bacterium]|nr:hypothetical protein [Flavobacteriales bacterium]
MKNFFKIGVFLLVGSALLSCDKALISTEPYSDCKQNVISNENAKLKSEPISGRTLTDTQIDSIAILHNLFLSQVVSNFEFNSNNYLDEMYYKFESIGLENFQISKNEIEVFLNSCNNDNYNYIKSNSENPKIIYIIDDLVQNIESNPDITFNEVHKQVSIKTKFAENNLRGVEQEMAIVFLKTFEKSSYFWMPAIKGGSGVGSNFIDKVEDKTGLEVNWGRIAAADGAGAAGVLLRTWYLAAFGPMSWGTIVGAIGWGAAWASGYALLTQLM